MRKAQLISMDFITTFMIYLFAISFFFIMLNSVVSFRYTGIDVSSELMYSKLDTLPGEYDFYEEGIVYNAAMEKIRTDLQDEGFSDNQESYDMLFGEFEDPERFSRIDYCVFVTDENDVMLDWFEAYYQELEDSIPLVSGCQDFGNPYCADKYTESIMLSRPVLYDDGDPISVQKEMAHLKVLICAEAR